MRKADIDDDTLERLAKGLGNGITPEMIKAYRHDDTVNYIINSYTQNVENGGTGTLQDSRATFQEGSSQNNYVAEQVFVLAEKNAKLEKLLLYYRMQIEPEVVKKEMETLNKELKVE